MRPTHGSLGGYQPWPAPAPHWHRCIPVLPVEQAALHGELHGQGDHIAAAAPVVDGLEQRFGSLERRFAVLESRIDHLVDRFSRSDEQQDRMMLLLQRIATAQGIEQ